jgi:hypothetical protein
MTLIFKNEIECAKKAKKYIESAVNIKHNLRL